MISFLDAGNAENLRFGDLVLDETRMFAHRNGRTIQFTRNERALLLALSNNPRRLMTRSRLLDEIARHGSDPSDRNIDFLVNRLRVKLGDSAKSPVFIATQYGEGYIWIAMPSRSAPADAFLIVYPTFELQDHPFREQALLLMEALRDMIAANIGTGRKVAVAERSLLGAHERLRYCLQVSFHADHERLNCAATLREMPSKRIAKTFRLHLDVADDTSFTREAGRVSDGVIGALRQALEDASNGLGVPEDAPPEIRLQSASSLLSTSNPRWLASGERLARGRAQDPFDPDAALQWCMHLFARLILTSPFDGMNLEERERLESEIEATVLECLPEIEDNPLLMLAAAKLLYFINRGHLSLAEEFAERSFARTEDSTAALPVLGQLRYARGRFDEAVRFFDQGIGKSAPDSEFNCHMRVLKCLALLAAGHSAPSAAQATNVAYLTPNCPPEIALTIGWTAAAPDQELPPALEEALQALGADRAARGLEHVYFTSARHVTSAQGRANVMRGMIAHVTRVYGEQTVPDFILRSIGSVATV